jgi:hypothetical protein
MASTQIDDGAWAKMSDFVEELYTAAKMIEEYHDYYGCLMNVVNDNWDALEQLRLVLLHRKTLEKIASMR